MSDLPAPLTPIDCDLQDFSFMPLQVARLRDSDLAAEVEPEACWYAVLLWAASWHQLPAASLPDNDTVLMKLCGLGRDMKTWKKFRKGALHGFILCDDGRLYHPVVAEQAIAAWEGKIEQRWRTECARIKKHNQRHDTSVEPPTLEAFKASLVPARPQGQHELSPGTGSGCPQGNGIQGTGKGTGTETETIPLKSPRQVQLPPAVRAVMEAGGFVSPPSDLGLLRQWEAAGADFEKDVLTTVRAVSKSVRERTGKAPFKLQLFDQPIRAKLDADAREIERLQAITKRMGAAG